MHSFRAISLFDRPWASCSTTSSSRPVSSCSTGSATFAGHCHGISGNAQLFLDVQEFLDPTAFTAEAHRSGRALLVRRIATDDGLTFANDTGNRVSVSYGQGVTGPIAYLSRLLYGTPRPFTWNPS